MTRIPTQAAINAAESRLVQSKHNVRVSMHRTQSALRAAIARPTTLVLVAVASGLLAYLLSRRFRPSVKSVPSGADSTIRSSRPSFMRTFVAMYGAPVLTLALQLGATAWKKTASRVNTNMPSTAGRGDGSP